MGDCQGLRYQSVTNACKLQQLLSDYANYYINVVLHLLAVEDICLLEISVETGQPSPTTRFELGQRTYPFWWQEDSPVTHVQCDSRITMSIL